MENTPHLSPEESTNQVPPAPASIEWSAMIWGCAVGTVWWIGQMLGTQILFWLANSFNVSKAFYGHYTSWGWMVYSFLSTLIYGTLIGCVVGYRARYRPYHATVSVVCALFFLTLAGSFISGGIYYLMSLFNLVIMTVSFVVSLAAALNGAYLAQGVKRNRGVKIQ